MFDIGPVPLALSVLLLVGLYQFANWMAPYYDLTEDGCVVGYVYDGDTVELICGAERDTARLQGFDTPETKDPRCPEEAALGKKATLRMRALMNAHKPDMDAVARDKYNRLLVRASIEGQNVGNILIGEGLAVPYFGGARIDWCAKLGGKS